MIQATLKLHTIRAFTHIGYFDTERATGQWIELSVELHMVNPLGSDTDDISSTIDYGYLTGKLTAFLEESQAKLIEKLAIDVAREVFRLDANNKINTVTIRIKKTSPSPNYDGHAVYELLADRDSI